MNNILILYPSEFASQSKFSRKLSSILKNMDNYRITYPQDTNELIKNHFKTRPGTELCADKNWQAHEITHAVLFDDGEVFANELQVLSNRNIPLRQIKITITRVINIRREESQKFTNDVKSYEYIGRGSYWGNPYSMYEAGEAREETIRKYQYDFEFDKFPNKEKSKVLELRGKRLGCFCKPAPCHGDVLAEYLNSMDDGE